MFSVIFLAFNVPAKSFVFNLLGYDESYFLQVDIIGGLVTVDFLYLKKPVLWLIKKIKELFK